MERNDMYSYTVERKEQVEIEVTPIGVGPFVTVDIKPVQQDEPTRENRNGSIVFRFSVTVLPGKLHKANLRFDFPGADDKSEYRIRTRGVGGSSWYDIDPVKKNSPSKIVGIRYEVPA